MIELSGTMNFIKDDDMSNEDKLRCLCQDAELFDKQVESYDSDVELAHRLLFKKLFKELISNSSEWGLIQTESGDYVIHPEIYNTYDITSAICNGRIGLSLRSWIGKMGSIFLGFADVVSEEVDKSKWCKGRKFISGLADKLISHNNDLEHGKHPLYFEELKNVSYGWSQEGITELHYFMYFMESIVKVLPFEIVSLKIDGTPEDSMICRIGEKELCAISLYRKLRSEFEPSKSYLLLLECIHVTYRNMALASTNPLKDIESASFGI